MTEDEKKQAANNEFDKKEKQRAVRLMEIADLRAAYEAMLVKVEYWSPPSVEHSSLKQFMIEQIKESIDSDCYTSYYETSITQMTASQWAETRRAVLERDLAYYTREYTKAVEQARKITEWVAELHKSLAITSNT
jgi:hypothetical protein